MVPASAPSSVRLSSTTKPRDDIDIGSGLRAAPAASRQATERSKIALWLVGGRFPETVETALFQGERTLLEHL